ncbi:MAG: hypothetical protein A2075_17575 [Geobacteraceae bacterium GWC2_58_44]|nr:MAG: hypothetical protein A2075_17575 [Geobacteraceae bacterium GWC2_58_44]HBG06553.1 hypothetical protein [Geobacter sp.]
MTRFYHASKRGVPALLLVCAVMFACGGCAATSTRNEQLPPLLALDELLRPYQKVATIEVRRVRYGSPSDLTPADYDWAYQALRQETSRIAADAVIFPEVRVELQRYLFFPVSEMKAKGIAIKFQGSPGR